MRKTLLLVVFVWLASCSGDSAPLTADGLEVSLPRPGTQMGAAYLRVRNATSEPITLTSVSSPQFEAVEMHETVITDGVSRMRKLNSVTIPADDSVAFERGGKHLMLMRPKSALDNVVLTFHADTSPVLSVQVSASAEK